MKTIAIYNNKGGVGKSTTTLFLADFFSSLNIGKNKARILVIDMDGQASTATALLGLQEVAESQSAEQSFPHFLKALHDNVSGLKLSHYIKIRKAGITKSKNIPLGTLGVMTPDRPTTIKLETSWDMASFLKTSSRLKKSLTKNFDIVFIDLPANIDERNKLALTGILIADRILIPTEPSRIALNALTDTFDIIQYARGIAVKSQSTPSIAGLLLNKTDRRTRQYKLHHKELFNLANHHHTTVFKNFLPSAPALAGSSDDSISFSTLKEKYETYYDNVRRVALELAGKCGYRLSAARK
ncbi:MAG: ParA family protein [Desulfobulbaceae bacterium]|nr:ParA family protein [Desulfobulbaceae bacterium]